MSKFLNNRYCKLKGCNEMIPVERHGNSTYCCDFHTMVGNSTYNAEYYKKRVQNARHWGGTARQKKERVMHDQASF